MKLLKYYLNHFYKDLKKTYKIRREDQNLNLKELIFSCYSFNKTSIYRDGTYIDSPKWLKDKKSTINPKNNDDKCFQYAVTLALNLDIIDNHPE